MRGRTWCGLFCLLAAGCTAQQHAAPEPVRQNIAAPDTTNVTNHWHQCLEESYRNSRTRTPDKNAAAEMAFQACASEEQDLTAFTNARIPPQYSPMPHLKAEVKRMLVDGEHLPIYPEQ